MKHLGIDFGAKKAGTTSICYLENGYLLFSQCGKNVDADFFLNYFIKQYAPDRIFLDAPLSLPSAYYDSYYEDFFYRRCDRELSAMSPMFLGGLTARAMALKHRWRESCEFVEVYPAALAAFHFGESDVYKKSLAHIGDLTAELERQYKLNLRQAPGTWHQFDSLLAWISGFRYRHGIAQAYGNNEEGKIII